MPFTDEDKAVIKHYRIDKNYGSKRLLSEFPDKDWTLGGLNTLLKKIDETGSIARRKGSGRPTEFTDEDIERVEELIQSQEGEPGTHLTSREVAAETGISRTSVRRIVKNSLGLTAFKKIKGQKLSEADIQRRLAITKRLLRKMTVARVDKTFFTDEKLFKLQQKRNTQNDRVYAKSRDDITDDRLIVERSAFPKNVMISAGVSKFGKTSVFFVEPNVKVNSDYYCNNLLAQMLPEMEDMSNGDYIFQQDGARAHTSKMSLEYLRARVPELWEPEDWSANSPDLNPLDYGIWEDLEAQVYRRPIHTMEELKARIVECWEEFPQETINKVIDRFRPRLRKCIEAEGEHFEHLL